MLRYRSKHCAVEGSSQHVNKLSKAVTRNRISYLSMHIRSWFLYCGIVQPPHSLWDKSNWLTNNETKLLSIDNRHRKVCRKVWCTYEPGQGKGAETVSEGVRRLAPGTTPPCYPWSYWFDIVFEREMFYNTETKRYKFQVTENVHRHGKKWYERTVVEIKPETERYHIGLHKMRRNEMVWKFSCQNYKRGETRILLGYFTYEYYYTIYICYCGNTL